jgi:hypothetical protein
VSISSKDPMVLVRFEDGGGMLSYLKKPEPANKDKDKTGQGQDKGLEIAPPCVVHTLNTESGLCRKMVG